MKKALRLCCLSLAAAGPLVSAHAQTPAPQARYLGLFVANLDSAQAWYERKLGFRVLQKQSPQPTLKFAMLEWQGFMLEMIQNPKAVTRQRVQTLQTDAAGTEGFFKLGFYVEDLEAWERTLKSRGVKMKYPMMENPNFRMRLFIVEDPEGNLIQFYKMLPPAAPAAAGKC